MKIQTTVTDLNQAQWDIVQRTVKTSYVFTQDTVRVCAVFTREGEERHAEMPLGVYVGLLNSIWLGDIFRGLTTAMAALTPDNPALNAWAAGIKEGRYKPVHAGPCWSDCTRPEHDRAKYGFSQGDPKDLYTTSLPVGPPCEHGSPVTADIPSSFKGSRSTRTYADGCQSYGPYQPVTGPEDRP